MRDPLQGFRELLHYRQSRNRPGGRGRGNCERFTRVVSTVLSRNNSLALFCQTRSCRYRARMADGEHGNGTTNFISELGRRALPRAWKRVSHPRGPGSAVGTTKSPKREQITKNSIRNKNTPTPPGLEPGIF